MRVLPKGRWPWLLTGLFLSLFPLGDHFQVTEAQDSKQDSGSKIEVKAVKYDALGKAITQLRGKVVVVDFWATT
jgi:ribosome biogenesis SPOUT family RNA methylase Rps3